MPSIWSPRQHLITQFLQARCSSWHPTNSVKALKAEKLTITCRVSACTYFANINNTTHWDCCILLYTHPDAVGRKIQKRELLHILKTCRQSIHTEHLLLLLHPFNGLFSMTAPVSRHQKGKPFWILLEQEIMGWQWHQLDHMQIICTLLWTDNCASTSPVSLYRLDALPAAQPTASKHWRHYMERLELSTASS